MISCQSLIAVCPQADDTVGVLSGNAVAVTAAEAGVPGYTAAPWNAIVAPKGVPQPIVAKLSAIFERIMTMPDTRAFFSEQHVKVLKPGAEAMRVFQREGIAKWLQIAADANIEKQ